MDGWMIGTFSDLCKRSQEISSSHRTKAWLDGTERINMWMNTGLRTGHIQGHHPSCMLLCLPRVYNSVYESIYPARTTCEYLSLYAIFLYTSYIHATCADVSTQISYEGRQAFILFSLYYRNYVITRIMHVSSSLTRPSLLGSCLVACCMCMSERLPQFLPYGNPSSIIDHAITAFTLSVMIRSATARHGTVRNVLNDGLSVYHCVHSVLYT